MASRACLFSGFGRRNFCSMKLAAAIFALLVTSLRLLAEDANPVSEILAQSDKMWDGTPLPHYPAGTPQISVLKIIIPPHSKLPWHKHPCINAGYVASGVLTVVAEGGEKKTLRAGDALIELVDKWHYGRNDGAEPVTIIVVYAGSPGVPLAVPKK